MHQSLHSECLLDFGRRGVQLAAAVLTPSGNYPASVIKQLTFAEISPRKNPRMSALLSKPQGRGDQYVTGGEADGEDPRITFTEC